MRETLANIGISIATNTALFTGLDLGQRIDTGADRRRILAVDAAGEPGRRRDRDRLRCDTHGREPRVQLRYPGSARRDGSTGRTPRPG